ncbi:MAG UNVERIFIED_CONTAM: hypothetical protein LVT10_25540 [Anaerolineae bacterium]
MCPTEWLQMGQTLGTFIGRMNQKSAHLQGMGTLSWNGAKLFGENPLVNLRLIERASYDTALEMHLVHPPAAQDFVIPNARNHPPHTGSRRGGGAGAWGRG